MAGSAKFAAGKYSWGMCDLCGVRTPYRDMREPTVRGRGTGLRVCDSCYDPDHPQNFLPYYVTTDPQALRDARPDTGLESSRQLFPPNSWPPYPPPPGRRTTFRDEEEEPWAS